MDDDQTFGGSPSLDAPNQTPAAVALRAEAGKLMRDPNWGKDPALTAQRDKLYADHYGSKMVEVDDSGITVRGASESQETQSAEDAARIEQHNTAVLDHLETMHGSVDAADQVRRGAASTVQELFPGKNGDAQFQDLAARIHQNYGPKVEALIITALHEADKQKRGG